MQRASLALAFALAISLTTGGPACAAGKKKSGSTSSAPSAPAAATPPADTASVPSFKELEARAKYTFSGLRFVVLREGEGPKPAPGTRLTVRYAGTLKDGTPFDASSERGFRFEVGTGQVIQGWDEALLDMRKGERRVLIVPPELGYGSRDMGKIPPNSILVFDVELVDF